MILKSLFVTNLLKNEAIKITNIKALERPQNNITRFNNRFLSINGATITLKKKLPLDLKDL